MTGRRTRPRRNAGSPRRDAGETLIEVLFAVTLLAGAGIVFLGGLFSAALSARFQENGSTAHSVAANAAETVVGARFIPCGTAVDYAAATGLPETAEIVDVTSWDGTRFAPYLRKRATGLLVGDVTTVTLSTGDGASFPLAGPYQIRIDDGSASRVMSVIRRDGDTLTAIGHSTGPAPGVPADVLLCTRLQRLDIRVERSDAADLRVAGQDEHAIVTKRGPIGGMRDVGRLAPATLPSGYPTFEYGVDLTGLEQPVGGTVTFRLYASDEARTDRCGEAGLVQVEEPLAVSANAHYPPAAPTPAPIAHVGTYFWKAVYSGDEHNQAILGECAEAGTISQAPPGPLSAATP